MKQRAALSVLLAATMAGSTGLFVKSMEMSTISMSFFRTAIPTVLLGSWFLIRGQRIFRESFGLMLGGSVLNVARMYLFFVAYVHTSIGNAILISYTWPIFVTLFSVVFLKERISTRNWLLLGLAFAGIVLVYINQPFSFANDDFIGMTAALGMALTYALTVVIFKRGSSWYRPEEVIFYQNLLGAVVFLPFVLFEPFPSAKDLVISASHATLLGMLGFYFFFWGLQRLKASTASGLAYIEIVSALLLSILVLKEPFTWNMGAGGALIIFSTALLRR